MNYEDFMKKEKEPEIVEEEEVAGEPLEIDVQKAVVESLAADKAERELEIEELRKEKARLSEALAGADAEKTSLKEEIRRLENEKVNLKAESENLRKELAKIGEILTKNTELPLSSQISLLERSTEIDDKFEGETRDHVIEVIREARDACEKNGRLRRAQLLESVLVANEAVGELSKRREYLEKLFADNQNLINGQVINELDKLGIAYKIGENYLLAKEIVERNY
ncbi:MAG: hypothetical protein K6G91_03650 [Kiritimatiellae bacterium]|nr:hypothetical protein [Kiritimatiellia bacterium]